MLRLLLTRMAAADTCDTYAEPQLVAELDLPTAEASGLAASRTRQGIFFTHGDNNDDSVVIAFSPDGSVLEEHRLVNAGNEDWEDIVAAPCPDEGDCLYIGDIGDNDLVRPSIAVHVIREPEEGDGKVRTIASYLGVYKSGPRDAETLLVHPCTGDLYVVTKDKDGRSEIFRFPAPVAELSSREVYELEGVATVQLDGPDNDEARAVTGGAWDPQGDRLALRTRERVLEWQTDPADPDAHWSDRPVELSGAIDGQGEGLTYSDSHLYGIGEGAPAPLSRWTCETPLPAEKAECSFPQTGRKCGCAVGAEPSLLASGLLALLALVRRRS